MGLIHTQSIPKQTLVIKIIFCTIGMYYLVAVIPKRWYNNTIFKKKSNFLNKSYKKKNIITKKNILWLFLLQNITVNYVYITLQKSFKSESSFRRHILRNFFTLCSIVQNRHFIEKLFSTQRRVNIYHDFSINV